MERSNRQRAVHKLCVIDTYANYCRRAQADFKVDGQFAKCHLPWPANMQECWPCINAKCLSCNSQHCPWKPWMLICSHCNVVCHGNVCGSQDYCSSPNYTGMLLPTNILVARSLYKMNRTINTKYRSVWHWFVPYNSCLCQTTGHCQLPPKQSEWEVKLLPWLGLISTSAFVLYNIFTYFYILVIVPISPSFMYVCLTIFFMFITAKKFSVF